MTAISGNTYPVKEQLKALGARWNGDKKSWMVPDNKAEEARKLVAGAPAGERKANTSYHPQTCRSCGAKQYRNSRGYVENKILRNGECVGCYNDRREGF